MKLFLWSCASLPLNHSGRVVVSYKRNHVHKVLVNRLFKLAQEKKVVRLTDCPAMTIAVDLGRKATKQTNKISSLRQAFDLTDIAPRKSHSNKCVVPFFGLK